MGPWTSVVNQQQKELTSPEPVIESSVSYLITGPQAQAMPNFSPMVAVNSIGGWRYAAMNLNANAFASTPLRLYVRNRKNRTPSFRALDVPKSRKKYLAAKSSFRVRRKAAEWNHDFVEVGSEIAPLAVLNTVNQFDDGFNFSWTRSMYRQATGDAYVAVVNGPDGKPAQLWTLPSQWTYIVPDRERFVLGYLYGSNQASLTAFDFDEVIHFKHSQHPTNLFYGLGFMEAGWNIVSQDIARNTSDLAFFQNYSRPDYIASIKGVNDQAAFDRLKAQLEGRHKGPSKSGRFLAISGDVDFKPMQFAPKDITGAYETLEQLAAVFGVPVSLLKANDPNLASATVGYASWREGTILPMCLRDEEVLNQSYLPRFEMGDAFFAYDNPVRDDETARADKAIKYVAGGIITPNEARADEGLEPLPGGDELRVAGALPSLTLPMPADDQAETVTESPRPLAKPEAQSPAANNAPEALTNAPQDLPNGAQLASMMQILTGITDGSIAPNAAYQILLASGLEPERARAAVDAQAEMAQSRASIPTPEPTQLSLRCCPAPKSLKKKQGPSLPSWPDAVFASRKAIEYQPEDDGGDADENVRQGEPETVAMRMRRDMKKILTAQCEAIGMALMTLPDAKSVKTKVSQQDLDAVIRAALGPDADQELAKALRPSLAAAVEAGGKQGLQRIGMSDEVFTVKNPKVAASLDKYSMKLAGTINDDTIKMVSQNVQSGLDQGKSVSQIASTYSNALPDDQRIAPGARSVVIARTETARAYVTGQEEGWKESEIVEEKKWLLAPGSCPFCEATAAKFQDKGVKLGDPFFAQGDILEVEGKTMTLDYSNVDGAPLHPNCRCDIEPVFKEVP